LNIKDIGRIIKKDNDHTSPPIVANGRENNAASGSGSI
jgi:hypothetical protein